MQNTNQKPLIVTRHNALIEYLAERGITGEVVSHADEAAVSGRDVVGVLPMRLASLARSFVEVSMIVPAEYRGKELTLADIRSFKPVLTEYAVRKVRVL